MLRSHRSTSLRRVGPTRIQVTPASRWNLTGDYGDTAAFQFLPLTAAANEIHGGHIRYASEFAELLSQYS